MNTAITAQVLINGIHDRCQEKRSVININDPNHKNTNIMLKIKSTIEKRSTVGKIDTKSSIFLTCENKNNL